MIVKKLRLKNFKCVRAFHEIELKPITLVFGPNSSGKSSIADALELVKLFFANPKWAFGPPQFGGTVYRKSTWNSREPFDPFGPLCPIDSTGAAFAEVAVGSFDEGESSDPGCAKASDDESDRSIQACERDYIASNDCVIDIEADVSVNDLFFPDKERVRIEADDESFNLRVVVRYSLSNNEYDPYTIPSFVALYLNHEELFRAATRPEIAGYGDFVLRPLRRDASIILRVDNSAFRRLAALLAEHKAYDFSDDRMQLVYDDETSNPRSERYSALWWMPRDSSILQEGSLDCSGDGAYFHSFRSLIPKPSDLSFDDQMLWNFTDDLIFHNFAYMLSDLIGRCPSNRTEAQADNGEAPFDAIVKAAFLREIWVHDPSVFSGLARPFQPELWSGLSSGAPAPDIIAEINRCLSEELFEYSLYQVAYDAKATLDGKVFLNVVGANSRPENRLFADLLAIDGSLRLNDVHGKRLSFASVGSGVSCVIPVIATAFTSNCAFIPQPELHLHPAMQMRVADILLRISRGAGKLVIVETHSEHIILRLLRRIRESSRGVAPVGLHVTPDDVAVYYMQPVISDGSSKAERCRIDGDGDFIDEWPDGFFDYGFEERFRAR